MSQEKTVLSVTNLSWQLAGKAILSAIDFSLAEGKMLGIIGPNGAGKSSLLRCLYRFITPTSGNIELFGQQISALSAKAFAKQVAVVLQDTPHHFEMTTSQLIALGLTPHKGAFDFTNKQDREEVAKALDKVGLTDKANQAYESLSGGEKQRALIARAIVQRTKLLILDEPTNHLDIRYQIQTLELLRTLNITVITSIHDLNLASALCDELLLLNNGQCVAKGEPKAVLTEQIIAKVFDVCCEIKPHPQHGNPLICYFYGYQNHDYQNNGYQNQGYQSHDVQESGEHQAAKAQTLGGLDDSGD
ncbi:ABC transporter ATP-binding protein [Shewanella pneumatophori]|uniref:ABC transporter ATP-binding protein n=1 Tax=Shewanella pneumatophori TaxID=314092 RepID=A0A9X1ZE46_9GAMM|nr:ABC transporter ATP-binding protein [Shewanella pneumatophori]MCL1137710.1 ABC transporter ATP-binding protein [Shewanella pneumatophori]